MITDKEQIVIVAADLNMVTCPEDKIKYVLDNIENEAAEDPSGNTILWIEKLLYEYDDIFEEKLYTFKYYKDGELRHTDINQKSDLCVLKYMHRAQSQSIAWATEHGGWRIDCIDQKTNEITEY